MQNIQEMSPISARLHEVDKESDTNASEVVKKLRLSVPIRESRNVHVTKRDDAAGAATGAGAVNRDAVNANPAHPNDNHLLQASLISDKYLLLDQVEGSSLYQCVNVHTQQELVCKVVTRDNSSMLAAHYRMDSSPHVQPLQEAILGDRYLFLMFARAHGDLHAHVRQRRRIREPEARRLFRQVAATVRECHENGIVLRDLKLRKFVFADPQRTELKLESLEDAVVLEEGDTDWLHDKRGCPAYVSPEILRAGARYSGKAADMWSLGVILYTMLVGRYPFNNSEPASLFAKISRGHFIVPECLSSRARCLIRALLRMEPSERICAEDVLLHPWLVNEDCESSQRSCSDQVVPQMVPNSRRPSMDLTDAVLDY